MSPEAALGRPASGPAVPTAEWPVRVQGRFTARGAWAQGRPWACDDLRRLIGSLLRVINKTRGGEGGKDNACYLMRKCRYE